MSHSIVQVVVEDDGYELVISAPGYQGPAGSSGPQGPPGPAGPAGSVLSVNGQVGVVQLTAASFGLAAPVVIPVTIPSALWVVAHSFPYRPGVRTYDVDGNEIDGDVSYPDGQHVAISWAGEQVGTVELT